MNDRAFCPSRSACDAPHGWDPYPTLVSLAYLPGQKHAAAFRSRSSAPSPPDDADDLQRLRLRAGSPSQRPVAPQASHLGEAPSSSLREPHQGRDPASHQGRDPALCYLVKVATVWGRIMKMMTREQLFAAPKLVRRAKGRFDRGMEAVSAARARATEIAQQCAALPKLIPTASHRRRLARLRASVP